MIKKRLFRGIVTVAVMSSLVVTPVFATESLETQKAAAQSEVTDLQAQLNTMMTKMNDLENQAVQKNQEINQATTDLESAQAQAQEQYDAMKLRIKYMYEDGDTAAVEKIISSGSFTEMLEQVEYASSIHTYDRNALTEYQETAQQISDLKASLEDAMTKLTKLEKEYQAKSQELSTTLEGKSAEVANLDSMIQEAARAAQAAAAAKAAEEAAAQAAAQQTPAADTNNGGGGQTVIEDTPTYGGGGGGSEAPSYNPATGNAVVDRAYSQLGAAYVWGACSPGAFDCSGFVSYCLTGSYSRLGTTYTFLGWQQVSDPQPGDVAVNENHCGIYIGGGMMVHAATEGVGVITGPVQGGMIFVRY